MKKYVFGSVIAIGAIATIGIAVAVLPALLIFGVMLLVAAIFMPSEYRITDEVEDDNDSWYFFRRSQKTNQLK
jgi:hypothetical protein